MQDTIIAVTIGEMFICSKLGAKSFGDRSQNICKYKESNLGQVAGLARLKLSTSKLFQLVCDERHDENKLSALRILTVLFVSFSFVARRGHFFCLNNLRKVRQRCSHSIFSSQAIILDIFDQNVA